MTSVSGTRLGNYELIEIIGRGGMATVYRARHIVTQQKVALKVLDTQSAAVSQFAKRLAREFEVMSALRHPNIVSVYDFGEQERKVFLAMELITNGSLASRREQYATRPLREVADLLTPIASGLTYAHAQGVVHRDLKPQNIMFNARNTPILTDFGIAKVLGEATALTKTGMILGTPAYMPPEQWRGEMIDARTDVYALGVMLFELLTGQQPFVADSWMSMLHLHIYQPPPPLTRLRPDIPVRVEWLINKALAKHPEGRFESASALANDFRDAIGNSSVPPTVQIVAPASPKSTNVVGDVSSETISLTKAAEQERHALERSSIPTESLIRAATRTVNPPPIDARERYKGRVKDLADVMGLLLSRARLITIYGRGGVGKTALACKVLADWQDSTDSTAPSGIVYLSTLRTGISLDRILADFGRLLGGKDEEALNALRADDEMPAIQKSTALLDTLKDGRYALLLDNLETLHNAETGELIDPDLKAFIEAVLTQGGGLSLLVTSREPLALPLHLRPQERLVPLDQGLQTEDAVALLRASDPDGTAGLRDAPDAKLITIVEKTRGFPRALEAVAGLLLEDQLVDLDTLLTEGRDGQPVDTDIAVFVVKQAIDRLWPAALSVMEALAVFNLPVRQAAIEYLLAPFIDTSGLRAVLNRLIRSYFVNFNKANGTFALHPIDREYCYTHIPPGSIVDRPAADQIPRYSQHVLNWRAAEFNRKQRKPTDSWKNIDDVAPQLAEFDYLVRAEDYDAAAQVLSGDDLDFSYLIPWGYTKRVLGLHEQLQGKVTDKVLARKSGNTLGNVYYWTGNIQRAIACFEQVLESARRDDDRRTMSSSLSNLGVMYSDLGQPQRAIDYYQQSLAIAREIKFRKREGAVLNNLANKYAEIGQLDKAVESYEEAIAIARETDDKQSEANALNNLGSTYTELGQVDLALTQHQQATVIAREIGNRRVEMYALTAIGKCLIAQKSYLAGAEQIRQALQIAEESSAMREKNQFGASLALALLFAGDLNQAHKVILDAHSVKLPENDHAVAMLAGLITLRLGDHAAAAAAFTEAVQLADGLLEHAPNLLSALFVRALSRCGLALLAPESETSTLIAPAREDYQTARSANAPPGILDEQRELFKLLDSQPNSERLRTIHEMLLV